MTEGRNTPRDIVFDMEDTIGDIRRQSSLLLLVAKDDGMDDVLGDGLHQLANGLLDSHSDLRDKWQRLFDQIVRNGGGKPEPAEPGPVAKSAVSELHRQWQMVRAKLNLDVLEMSGGTDDTLDSLIDAARERYRAIEHAILATDPDSLGDFDLVEIQRLARTILGHDEFVPEQQERAEAMLDLIETALARRETHARLAQAD